MVRFRRFAAALALAGFGAPAFVRAPARAQALQTLTVQSFVLSSDVRRPQAGVPFHLIVTLRVRERVAEIGNLELPMLAQLELQGDERALYSSRGGTVYREIIGVVAHQSGIIAISPALLQAIDARDRRPKQYFSNPLTLDVAAVPGQALAAGARAVWSVARFAFQLALWILGGLCAAALLVLVFRRRAAPPAAATAPMPLAPAHAPPPSANERLRDALTVLHAERTRAAAVRVRAAVWQMVGASDGETLADVLQRPQSRDDPFRGLLIALERAAFTYDEDLSRAVDDACDALQRCVQP